jgi:hypothetical protein
MRGRRLEAEDFARGLIDDRARPPERAEPEMHVDSNDATVHAASVAVAASEAAAALSRARAAKLATIFSATSRS